MAVSWSLLIHSHKLAVFLDSLIDKFDEFSLGLTEKREQNLKKKKSIKWQFSWILLINHFAVIPLGLTIETKHGRKKIQKVAFFLYIDIELFSFFCWLFT